eukprot:7132889-Pyramimonas_sp.AAC.1
MASSPDPGGHRLPGELCSPPRQRRHRGRREDPEQDRHLRALDRELRDRAEAQARRSDGGHHRVTQRRCVRQRGRGQEPVGHGNGAHSPPARCRRGPLRPSPTRGLAFGHGQE